MSHGQLGREDVVGHEEREGEEGRGEEKRYLLQTKKLKADLLLASVGRNFISDPSLFASANSPHIFCV